MITKRKFLLAGAAGLLVATGVSAADLPQELRVGFQKGSSVLVVAKHKQVLEQRLGALGVERVRWVEFQFGPPLLEALGLGSVDIGSVGDTPPIFAQAANANLVYVAVTPASQSAILVPKSSPLKTVADLKGKRVALGKGSSSHNLTVQALALAGLSFNDIEPAYLGPADAAAAFASNRVDAWTVWDPYFAIAELKQGARPLVTTQARGLESNSFYLANRRFAERYPAALQASLDELGRLTEWAGRNRGELAALSAAASGVDVEAQKRTFERAEFGFHPLDEATIAKQQEIADSFHALGLIPKKIDVRRIVWSAPNS